jgi:uroporphyrinogen decarboxylase
MNSRERVLRALKRKEGLPDRVPVQFCLCQKLLEHFSKKLDIPISYTNNLYEDCTYRMSGTEIKLALGSDVVVTGAGTAGGFKIDVKPDGTWVNEYGMRMKQGSIYVEIVEFPLAHAQTIDDIENYQFPDPYAKGRYDDAEKLVKKYGKDYLVFADIEVTIFSLAQQLLGMEKLLMDMATGEEYIGRLFEKCADFQTKVGVELINKGIDAIWVGDDFGSQTNLLFSEALFRELLKPLYKKMVDAFKETNPDIITIIHSDGAVRKLLNDLYEIGFEVFNPVQPGVPGHSPKELKDEFGEKLSFFGAIDQQELLPKGTDEELEKDIIEKINILGANGGYIVAPAHIIQSDVSPERVEKFIELCKLHGKYN